MEENNVNVPQANNDTAESVPVKSTRWIGLVAIVAFFILGGWSYCPWHIWIVFVLLALLTFGGIWKWTQLILGVCVILWGTPVLSGDSHDDSSSSHYEQTAVKQSDSERRYIENQISQIEAMQRRFERADELGLSEYEQKQLSDQAWNMADTISF